MEVFKQLCTLSLAPSSSTFTDLFMALLENFLHCSVSSYPSISAKIVHVRGSGGTYSIPSFAGAKKLCAARGMVVAPPEQMKAAHKAGYSMCACGWLSDGKAGYVVQKRIPGHCEGPGLTRACGWRTKWDAYCART